MTSFLITGISMEDTLRLLEKVLYMHYPLCLQKDLQKTRALIDSCIKVNAMTPAYTSNLGLKVQKTNIEA